MEGGLPAVYERLHKAHVLLVLEGALGIGGGGTKELAQLCLFLGVDCAPRGVSICTFVLVEQVLLY